MVGEKHARRNQTLVFLKHPAHVKQALKTKCFRVGVQEVLRLYTSTQ